MTKMVMEIQDATKTLAALAHEMRLRIFRILIANDQMSAGALAKMVGVAPSTLSFHLKDLRHAGLVHSTKNGREVIYTANIDTVNALLGYLVDDCCGGHRELCIQTHSASDV